MKRLGTLLLLLVSFMIPLESFGSDWDGQDKKQHAKYSFAIASMTDVGLNMLNADVDRPLASMLACWTVGTGKELYDIRSTGFDEKDLTYDFLFCWAGAYLTDSLVNLKVHDDYVGVEFKKEF